MCNFSQTRKKSEAPKRPDRICSIYTYLGVGGGGRLVGFLIF